MNISMHFLSLADKKTYEIDSKKKTFEVNGKPIDTDVDNALFYISMLSSSWPEKLENEKIIDGLTFKITVKDDDEKKSSTFKNEFPEDFGMLIEFLDEVESVHRSL